MKKTVTEILKEMIPVVLGVLVALFINNWAEDIKDRAYISEITNSMKLEFDESLKEIDDVIPKQTRVNDSLRRYISDETKSIIDIVRPAGGLFVAQVKTNSWNAISQTKIELLEYAKLKVLSDIEYGKGLLREKERFMGNFVFSNLQETSQKSKETLVLLISDIINTERLLKIALEEYQAIDTDEVD